MDRLDNGGHTPYHIGMSPPIKIVLFLFALAVSGCASTQKIRTVIPNPSGINVRPAEFEIVKPPDRVWEPVPLDYTPSYPLSINKYERPVALHPETVAAVYEVILTDDTATIKTLEREYVIAQPGSGEEMRIRTGSDHVDIYVGGELEEITAVTEIKRLGFFGRFWRWGAVIAALGGGLFLWLKLRGDKSDQMMDKLLKVMTMGVLKDINRK